LRGNAATGDAPGAAPTRGARIRSAARSSKSWAGYAWFMSLGTFLPLPIMLAGYLVNLTLVAAGLARQMYAFAIFLATLGQPPPGQDRLKARADVEGDKKPLAQRIRPYLPPGLVERRQKPVPVAFRAVWFVLVGWWAGALWVVLAWSVLLLPYPLPDVIRSLLRDLPSLMTLAWPEAPLDTAAAGPPAGVRARA
jgi:hypothetical protein